MTVLLTLAAIADGLAAGGLATREEIDRLTAELEAVTYSDDIAISFPRIFQAWAVNRRRAKWRFARIPPIGTPSTAEVGGNRRNTPDEGSGYSALCAYADKKSPSEIANPGF
jgi:hypothetical protein